MLLASRLLAVDRIVVHGTTRLSSGEVEVLLDGIRGQNLLRVNLDQYRRRVLDAPATRNFDLPARSYHMVPILEVPESHVMSDSAGRQVIVYMMMDNPHAKGLLMGWIPHAKMGYVTDVWTPGPPLPAKPNPGLASVVNTVKRAGIDPERFAGGHGGMADYPMLARLVGN